MHKNQPLQQFYNLLLPTKISTDSSKRGLGTILERKRKRGWHPIVYASRTTTPAEQNYCPLDQEALNVLSSYKRFVYGYHLDV